jgi:two-component system sensor histidine kinase HydH
MSSAPGWRELRWFACCSALAALFNLANITTNVPVSDHAVVLGSRFAMFFGGLHTAAWFEFSAAQQGRRLRRFERAMVATGVCLAAAALVPGLFLTDEIRGRPVPWLGVVYRDGIPTTVGSIAFGYHVLALAFLFVRYVWAWSRRERHAATYAIVLGAMLGCALHDSLAMEGIIQGPYLLDVSLLVVVLVVGGSLTSRFVASARALERSSRSLAIAQEELVKRERLAALGELAAMVAHEVRNPLGVVFNALSGLRRAPVGSADHDELMRIAQEEAERIRDIISDLLEFARPRTVQISPAPVQDVVGGAVDAARRAVDAPQDAVVFDAATDLSPLPCDEQLVRQAVINLVSNALQAGGRRRPVKVEVAEEGAGSRGRAILIRVIDDGEGVAADLRDRIFTPFYSTRATGTGLGLAVVRRTAQAHGGDVELAPTPGGGATFTLRLPRSA